MSSFEGRAWAINTGRCILSSKWARQRQWLHEEAQVALGEVIVTSVWNSLVTNIPFSKYVSAITPR